jgi:hypothetical protein
VGLSTKAMLAGAAGLATLSLVGVGVGANMADSATAVVPFQSGNVGLQVKDGGSQYTTNSIYYGTPSLNSFSGDQLDALHVLGHDNLINSWNCAAVPNPAPLQDSSTATTDNSVACPPITNVGSNFYGKLFLTLANPGTRTLNYIQLAASDTATGDSVQLAKDTIVEVYLPDNHNFFQESLYQMEQGQPIELVNNPNVASQTNDLQPLAHGATETVEIILQSDAGASTGTDTWRYNNGDQNQTMTPTFTFTASDAPLS